MDRCASMFKERLCAYAKGTKFHVLANLRFDIQAVLHFLNLKRGYAVNQFELG